MSPPESRDTDVLIIGAGPTGLVLALWLARMGVRVRIVDKTAEPGTTSRAVAVQARTLELYNQIGLGDVVAERGYKVGALNLWVAGKKVTRVMFGALGTGMSPFPYALTFPQDEHERLLIDWLHQAGVEIERQTEVVELEDGGGRVLVRLKRRNASQAVCEVAYVAGCDGAHSIARQAVGIGFPGGTYDHLFYVADVEGRGTALGGDIEVALDTTDFLAVFPLKGPGRARLVGTVRDGALQQGNHQDDLSWDDVSKRVIQWMQIDVERVNWFSTYRVHHRVADHFRKGRVFLLGDAAHIHSPVGGQGMNTGIGDAVNLAWKLAAVLHGRATASLLDSYEPERIAFARRLVATTDEAFTSVTSPSLTARIVRLDLVPFILPTLFRVHAFRRLMFRTVSQTSVNYRGSALSEGICGPVHGGDRLPWVQLDGGSDNFAPLISLDWQVHVYGESTPGLQAVCAERKLPLHVFPWERPMFKAGVRRDAIYLVRPDGYVGLVDRDGKAPEIAAYLDARKLTAATTSVAGNTSMPPSAETGKMPSR